MKQQKVVFATSNPNKIREAQQILGPLGFELTSLAEMEADVEEPVEDGVTFADNARLKARYYAQLLGCPCLAEDSGLCVPALGGEPGVYSARYADARGTREQRDAANNEKLLSAAASLPDAERGAFFESAVCLAQPDGRVVAETAGRYEGALVREPSGEGGFGYDPLLFVPQHGCTSAELTPGQKNAISHRGKALRELARVLSKS